MTVENWIRGHQTPQLTEDDNNTKYYNSEMIDDMEEKIQRIALYYRDIILAKINKAKKSSSSKVDYDNCFKKRAKKGYSTDQVFRLGSSMLQKMKEINTKQSLEEYKNDLDILETQANITFQKILRRTSICMKISTIVDNMGNIYDNAEYYRQLIGNEINNYDHSSNSGLKDGQCFNESDMRYPTHDVYRNATLELLSMPNTSETQLSEDQKKYIINLEVKVNNTLNDIKNNGIACLKNLTNTNVKH